MRNGFDPELLEHWVRARSVARELPPPVVEHGGSRVETGSPTELRRWVFPCADGTVTRAASAEREPDVLLKCCADVPATTRALPSGWRASATGWVMLGDAAPAPDPELPDGYALEVTTDARVFVRIVTANGEPAAGGFAASSGPVFIYDRIVVEPAHRRRGLGRALMGVLGGFRPPGARPMLIATDEGRALYETLGWSTETPYSTAQRTS